MARRRYQRGRVFLRGKKAPQWVGRWREDVIQPDGSVVRIERSLVLGTKAEIPTKRLAERRLEPMLARINGPDYRPGRIATVAEFAERWKQEVLARRKPSTIHAASSHLRCYVLPLLGKARLDALGVEAQQMFIGQLSQKVSHKTVFNVLGTLASMLNTAKHWGYVCEGVSMKKLTLPEQSIRLEARFFTGEQARQIIAAAEQPWRTMFDLAAMAGLRAGEVLGLRDVDLDFEKRVIFVRQSVWRGRIQSPKSRNSEAALPMPDPLAAILREYLVRWQPNSMRLLFLNSRGRPFIAENVVRDRLWPILDSLKIPRCGFHAFRHMHCSLLLDTGASPAVARAQLRHSDPRTTLESYGHIIGDSHRQAVEKVAQILRPNAPNSETSGQWIQ